MKFHHPWSIFIVLVLKPKDYSDLGTCRLISLINQDAMTFTAVLAKRMDKSFFVFCFANYIGKVQSGFKVGRQMADLTRRILNIIHIITKHKLKAGIVALDIFKVFDWGNGQHWKC